ncbi:TPA: ATP-binding protein [Pseudomonas aeruginosa]|uniref:ATP-binding protein n=1 Tax=Pseudomonas TaxID=286 RepID=UPI002950D582|nr:ATP-binding protein [Pseudomonas aeruginosa]MCO2865466.1 ATP-binding protein [Pseudomonas aeruginosa]MCO3283412.1 ATP-binding protein [Pseudomonas aeruginosa]MDV6624193.1 ATP-binding protein [Pseudomonas aeruginosa]MDY1448803.1 ATP-binding protein [Pseudomonas aeruginosa]HCE6538956.1 ATP-binding protein [Pseudomonas aeruginosa]
MSTIRLQTNQNRLIEAFRHAFTQASMLGELLQNARRAKARHIHITTEDDTLTVSDDGQGIDNLQTLICIAESGWDQDLKAREHPFGIGVLSALYFARSLRVHSLDKAFRATTAAIINGDDIDVIAAPTRVGTEIRLCGVEPPYKGPTLTEWVAQQLLRLCEAFPVRVTFNGKEVDRPLAWQELAWRNTDIGQVLIDLNGAPSLYRCYLQGLPIGGRPNSPYHQIVILRDDMIARLPDRQHLLHEEEDGKRIRVAVTQAFRQALIEAKERLSGVEFVMNYASTCLSSSNADLLNSIPFAPRSWFRDWEQEPPGFRNHWARFWDRHQPEGVVAQEALQDVGVWSIDAEDEDDVPTAEVYLETRDAFLLDESRLDRGHWLFDLIRYADPDQVGIHHGEVLHVDDSLTFNGDIIGVTLVGTLSASFGDETREYPVSAIRRHGRLYVTPYASDVTRLLSDYVFDDRYDQDREDEDAQTIATFIAVGCAESPTRAIEELLPSSLRHTKQPKLAGVTVSLSFDAEGKLVSVK